MLPLTLAAQIAESLKDEPSRDAYVEQALAAFGTVKMLSDWELGWMEPHVGWPRRLKSSRKSTLSRGGVKRKCRGMTQLYQVCCPKPPRL